MKSKILALFAVLSMAVPSYAFAGEKWNDTSDPIGGESGPRVSGSQYPFPTRNGLVTTSVLNLVTEQCDADTDGSTDNYTRLQRLDNLTYFFTDDGGSFVNDTTDANSAAANDVDPWPATPAVGDAIYIGSSEIFNYVMIDIGTAGSTVMTVTWEYSAGEGWETLSFNRQEVVDFDETAGVYYQDFEPPLAWVASTVNSVSAYWVRARVTAFTSHTTNALLDQVQLGLWSSNPGHEILIKHEKSETEDLWLRPCADVFANTIGPDVDEGIQLKAGDTYRLPVLANPREMCVCTAGGTAKIQVAVDNDGQVGN